MTIDKARRRKAVARWHRRFAIFISLWLLVLASTGVLINHAHDWGLDRDALPAYAQKWVYGIQVNTEDFCTNRASTEWDCSKVFARLVLPTGALLLTENNIFLLNDTGQLLEKLAVSHLGLDKLQAGFQDNDRIYLRDQQTIVSTDHELMESTVLDPQAVEALNRRDWKIRHETSEAISWERFLLDLHAARFFGPAAKAFNDLMAALIFILAISGIWLYRLKRKTNGNGSSGGNSIENHMQ